ncbi:helix-turn-helix domain containing protein [Melghirimyces algeriensis]|nr:helix-turn-helix domain containing protein [Melghirimyces algeriensis]
MGRPATVTPLSIRRRKIYIALEDLDFIWDEDEIPDIERMWNQGFSLWDIAHACERDELEVLLLIMDRERQGSISPRKNGLFRGEEKQT